jgi:hypothetical protein
MVVAQVSHSHVPRDGSVPRRVETFRQADGTDIPSAAEQHFPGRKRVVVVTDEQTRPGWFPSNAHARERVRAPPSSARGWQGSLLLGSAPGSKAAWW